MRPSKITRLELIMARAGVLAGYSRNAVALQLGLKRQYLYDYLSEKGEYKDRAFAVLGLD